jgi:hypothetical protein
MHVTCLNFQNKIKKLEGLRMENILGGKLKNDCISLKLKSHQPAYFGFSKKNLLMKWLRVVVNFPREVSCTELGVMNTIFPISICSEIRLAISPLSGLKNSAD